MSRFRTGSGSDRVGAKT